MPKVLVIGIIYDFIRETQSIETEKEIQR